MKFIEKYHSELSEIHQFLQDKGEISHASSVQVYFCKYFILSVASYFEYRLIEMLTKFFENKTNSDALAMNFIKLAAFERKYHQYFDWKSANANQFFAFFGDDFKKEMAKLIESDSNLKSAISDFIKIGRERNTLAHENFGAAQASMTIKEAFDKAKSASFFLDFLDAKLQAQKNNVSE